MNAAALILSQVCSRKAIYVFGYTPVMAVVRTLHHQVRTDDTPLPGLGYSLGKSLPGRAVGLGNDTGVHCTVTYSEMHIFVGYYIFDIFHGAVYGIMRVEPKVSHKRSCRRDDIGGLASRSLCKGHSCA